MLGFDVLILQVAYKIEVFLQQNSDFPDYRLIYVCESYIIAVCLI